MTSMTTSQPNAFLSEIVSGETIPPDKLGYFRGRLSNKFHELVLDLFDELERAGKITRASLARRIGKAPEQVTRWLGAPGNWTLDTASDLFLGMGYEPALAATNLADQGAAESAICFEDLPLDSNAIVELPVMYIDQFAQQIQSNGCYFSLFQNTAVQTASISNAFLANNFQWQLPTGNSFIANTNLCLQYASTNTAGQLEEEEIAAEWPQFQLVGAESLYSTNAYFNRRTPQGVLQ